MNRPALISHKLDKCISMGIKYLCSTQQKDGSWKGDYGGPMFLLPMFIGACYITGEKISEREKRGFIEYFLNVQNPDGSIGLHAEAEGCMFTTALSYVSLRILGLPPFEKRITRMSNWILSNGTALGSASWGKFFLALLNLCPYEGLNPLLPELWALPYALPFHPGRLWCHARQVYLPMSYLYGTKARFSENDLIRQIRKEIYASDYSCIRFGRFRNYVSDCDNYNPNSALLKAVNFAMSLYERVHNAKFRKNALETVYDHVLYEDIATNFIDIGPVNSVLNTLVHFFKEGRGDKFVKSMAALKGYICRGHDGMKMNGYNSTALWDTAFAVQAICAAGRAKSVSVALKRAYAFICDNQVLEDPPENERYYRHASRGGWPFSDRDHGWPITDCTAEGYKAEGLIRKSIIIEKPVPDELLRESVELMLSFQNHDGGWATYELKRGGNWLELLNPSSVFGKIMVDYSYVECSSSCIQALSRAKNNFSGKDRERIEKAVRRGVRFILNNQRPDGSFEGSWAVCFTYGTWFGVWGLLDGGISAGHASVRKACEFLLSKQKDDGGWGEHYMSCVRGQWVDHEESQTVNTAWALMTLVRAGLAATAGAARAADFLIKRQMKNGDWPRESLVGVFNKTALINYENYRRYFPIWALGLYESALRDY
jgi:squalene/oxidosqualene cyclase-like protein